MTTAALAAAATMAMVGAGTASAATTEELANVIVAGLEQPVNDVILNGDSMATPTVGAGPVQSDFPAAFIYSQSHPDVSPAGANDLNCTPKDGQRPVVLVHGTWENAYSNFAMLAPALKAAGLCVFALNYGQLPVEDGGGLGQLIPGANGTGDIAEPAGQLATFVDQVLATTGAEKVNVVGHSQGGLMTRQYLKFNGGAGEVDNLVTLGATNHGTTIIGIGALGACDQQPRHGHPRAGRARRRCRGCPAGRRFGAVDETQTPSATRSRAWTTRSSGRATTSSRRRTSRRS